MKKTITILAISLSSFSFAQNNDSVKTAPKMNIIKTNVTAFAFKNINISYERAINKWFSINVGFGTTPQGKIPFVKSFTSAEDELRDLQAGLTNFTLETRFYLGKGYGKGFYIAPYFRNSNFKTDGFTYNYEYFNGVNTTEIPIKISGDAKGNSAGLLIGAQFFLNKKQNFILDWWIVGAHYGKGKGDFTGTSSQTLTPDMQAQLKEDLENLDIPMVKYTVETNDNGAKINLDGPWAGLRSGLSLGYRF